MRLELIRFSAFFSGSVVATTRLVVFWFLVFLWEAQKFHYDMHYLDFTFSKLRRWFSRMPIPIGAKKEATF